MSEQQKRPFEQAGDVVHPEKQAAIVGTPQDTTRSVPLQPESMLKPGGWGVENGVPYGTQLRDERTSVNDRWKFFPGAAARLSAATRRALGR